MRNFLLLSITILFSFESFAITGSKNALKPLQIEKTELASPDIPGSMVVDIGFMNLSNPDDAMNTSFWGSKSFGVYYMKPMPINDKMTFNVSLGIGSEKYAFDSDITLGHGIDPNNLNREITTIDTLGFSARKSKLATTYLDLPIELRFGFGGNPSDGGFFAIGAMAGILIDGHTKIKYEENGRNVINKVKDDFGLSNFRYGLSGRLGFRGFNLYYKHYFSKLFSNGEQPQGTTAEPNPWAMGISFNLF
jgi:hypothetical protein